MSDQEDLELEALQRKLDDAFETTRPRRGFEDELWLRMQRKRPFGARIADAFGGLVATFREAPAMSVAATALVLIVVVGIGVLSSGISPFANHGSASTASAPNPADRGSAYLPGQRLPTPALHPGLASSQAPQIDGGTFASQAPNDAYYGPANLTWSGSFATDAPAAPVLVYTEPTDAQKQVETGSIAAQGVTVTTRGSVPQLPLEPTFVVTETGAGVAQGADPVVAATSFLAAHNLLPSWSYEVVLVQSGPLTRVVFQRSFELQGGGSANLINWNGDRYGLEVDIVGGRRIAIGPLQLSLQSTTVPLISNDQAAQMALSEPPATTQSIQPIPTVTLDHVQLVYALAVSGGSGFYEPAYLFSGTFQYNGQTYTKRVLVPLVDPSLRS